MNGQFDLGELKPSRYFSVIGVVLGLLFSFVAGEDDGFYGWLLSALLWQIQTVVPLGLAIYIHSQSLFNSIVTPYSPIVKLLVSGLIASMLTAPIALAADIVLSGELITGSYIFTLIDEWFSLAPPVIICWVAINLPFVLGYRFSQNNTTDIEPQNNLTPAGFEQLVPPEKRGELIYVKSELHYLMVVTTNGESLILYSLKNAIAELGGQHGLQSHRSYWVNARHVKSFNRKGREGELILSNDARVPVSRSNIKTVEMQFNS